MGLLRGPGLHGIVDANFSEGSFYELRWKEERPTGCLAAGARTGPRRPAPSPHPCLPPGGGRRRRRARHLAMCGVKQLDEAPRVCGRVHHLEAVPVAPEEAPGAPATQRAFPGVEHHLPLVHIVSLPDSWLVAEDRIARGGGPANRADEPILARSHLINRKTVHRTARVVA